MNGGAGPTTLRRRVSSLKPFVRKFLLARRACHVRRLSIEHGHPSRLWHTHPLHSRPRNFPICRAISGVRLGVAESGVRYQGRTDLLVVELAPGTTIAGVFTKSTAISAPAKWCRANVGKGKARAFIDNSGNANAFTGKAGDASVKRTVAAAAKLLGCKPSEVFVASTGIIGVPLPDEKITAALPGVLKNKHERDVGRRRRAPS